MSKEVLLDEGGSVSVHTRIKDMCKEARNRMHLTNQDISDMICKRFGFEDFSVNTINNFFSERSKATTIYTTGYICAVLNISMDTVFGIERATSPDEENAFVRELSDVKVELRLREQEVAHLRERMEEKDRRLEEVKGAVDYYRAESNAYRRKVQPWVFTLTLSMLLAALLFILVYLLRFDVGNPNFGIFT